jgi:hypothetical protein
LLISIANVFFCIAVFANKLDVAKAILLLKHDVLNLMIAAGFTGLAVGVLGIYGGMTHKKYLVLAFAMLLWVVGGIYLTAGYYSYKTVNSFQFESDMTTLWSGMGPNQAVIQNKVFHCNIKKPSLIVAVIIVTWIVLTFLMSVQDMLIPV